KKRGSGSVKRRSNSASSGFTRQGRQSCSRARPVISSSAHAKATCRSACFSAARFAPAKSDGSSAHLRRSSRTSFTSRIATKSNRRSPTGCGRRTNSPIDWLHVRQSGRENREIGQNADDVLTLISPAGDFPQRRHYAGRYEQLRKIGHDKRIK